MERYVLYLNCQKILLGEGFDSALTERFCQDDVEEYFGYQLS